MRVRVDERDKKIQIIPTFQNFALLVQWAWAYSSILDKFTFTIFLIKDPHTLNKKINKSYFIKQSHNLATVLSFVIESITQD